MLLVIVGSGLLTWVSIQRKARAGVISEAASLVKAFGSLFDKLGKFLGPDPAGRAGAFLIVVGVGLIVWATVS